MLLLTILFLGGALLAPFLIYFPHTSVPAPVHVSSFYLSHQQEREKEHIEQSVVTICETIKVLRKLNGCYTGVVNELLGFLQQGSSYKGTISNLSLYPRSSTFSCANADNYGRYLLFSSLTPAEISNYGYDIDVGKIGLDPCGIGDFVYRR